MARLSLALLGPLEVTLDGEPITSFESNKVRALLAYLAVETDRPHRRDALVALLWPDWPDRAARANLRNALANLRGAIGDRDVQPPFLLITRETIQFNSASDSWIDVAAFRASVEADQTGRPPTQQLEEAAAAYRGPFLEGFSLKGSVAFDDWSLLTRERLQRQALTALQRLAEEYERQGELERACEVAWRQVELEPWQEAAHRELMRLLALSGQRSAALAQYDACRRTLMEELRIEPAEETTALYERIRDGLELPSPPRGPPHNLPAPLTPLIGRKAELAEIKERLQDPTCRLLSLVGPGGSGKTHLALEAAARQLHNFRHGAFFVSLAPLQSVDAIVPTVAQALGFPLTMGTERDSQQQLLDYLRTKRMLLLLDNFEHLLEGVGLVTRILTTAPQVKVMTTSRARLNARGEHLLPVLGMDVPPSEAQASLTTQYSAAQLFLHSARRVRPGFDPTADDLTHVARICRLVEGMPLAILLAASWMTMLTPAEIAAQIAARSLNFLETEWRDVPSRQRSMRAVFDHSWGLLAEHQRDAFAGLSVFRGGFLHEAAQEVTGASLRELKALVDRSLLQRTPSRRYEVHELLRQYGAEQLALSGAEEAVQDRHCAYYAAALQGWEPELRGPRQRKALEEMGAEIGNTRAAWAWAVDRGDVACLRQAMEGLCRFYERRGRFQEGETASRVAAERLRTLDRESSGEGLRVLARALAWQGLFSTVLGRTELACQLLEEGLGLLDSPPLAVSDTRPERALLLQQLGYAVKFTRREEARQHWTRSLALYRALDDRCGMASVVSHLADLSLHLGEYGQAKRMYEQGLRLRRSLGDRMGIANALVGLGLLAAYQGQLDQSERLVRESIAVLQDIGDWVGVVDGRCVLAVTLLYQGRYREAHRLGEEIAILQDDLGRREMLSQWNQTLVWVKVNLGWYEQARELQRDNLAFFREIGDRRAIGLSLIVMGEIALAEGAYAEAWQPLQESIALFREVGQRDELPLALAAMAQVERGLGRVPEAEQCLHEALQTAAQIRGFSSSIHPIAMMALLMADRGKVERAIELYALVSHYPYVANSRWFEDIAGKRIAAVAATLPPDAVAAAQERGRARDLQATVAELLMELEAPSEGG